MGPPLWNGPGFLRRYAQAARLAALFVFIIYARLDLRTGD